MHPDAHARFTQDVVLRLGADPDVLGVVGLGSTSGLPPLPDAASDHDLFVITRPGAQERLRTELGWLAPAGRIALAFRETAHGVKVVLDDGHLVEFAAFDLEELHLARVNRFGVLLDRCGLAERLTALREETVRALAGERSADAWVHGQLLTEILVAGLRARRGERIAARLRLGAAARQLLELAARHLPGARAPARDDLDPSRRAEVWLPGLAEAIDAILCAPLPAAAGQLLELAVRAFDPAYPGWSRAGAAAVARALGALRDPADRVDGGASRGM